MKNIKNFEELQGNYIIKQRELLNKRRIKSNSCIELKINESKLKGGIESLEKLIEKEVNNSKETGSYFFKLFKGFESNKQPDDYQNQFNDLCMTFLKFCLFCYIKSVDNLKFY